jgi:hypothetical protein
MVREMITLPLRVGVCATRLGVHVTTRVAGVALSITRRVIGGSVPTESRAAVANAPESSSTFELDVVVAQSSPPPPEPAPAAAPAPPEATPEPRPTAPSAPAVAPAPDIAAAPEIPPAHVSEGVQFVEAFAEPGAEEDVGAAVHVEEPWRGYAQMTADEVIVRLADATPEQLAVVALYEGVHRGRKTVLAAARRQLRSVTAGRPAQAGRP